jgi:CubicO group peptidase (beta-lactamase class C family)
MTEVINPAAVGLSAERLARIRPVMQRYVDEQKFAGIVTLIARRGQVAHFDAVGHADLSTARPMALDTIFRIYSMTKAITSVAIMMLYERGELLLTDPVATFIPAFGQAQVLKRQGPVELELAPLQRPITIRDLLTHTAGLSYGFFVDSPVELMYQGIHNVNDFWGQPTLYPTDRSLAEMVEAWARLPLIHQPGTAWRYSVATDVLGRVVEVISGRSLGQFFQEEIFQPLGMVDTGFIVPPAKVGRFAAMYTPAEGGGLTPIDHADNSPYLQPRKLESGGGGLVSTATDYWRFCQAMLNGGVLDGVRLLGRKTVALMTMNHIPLDQLPLRHGDEIFAGEGFGLGFGVIVDPAASQLPWSAGTYYWGGAANTTFWIDPQEDLIGILMTQFMPSSTYPVNEHFRVLAYQALE